MNIFFKILLAPVKKIFSGKGYAMQFLYWRFQHFYNVKRLVKKVRKKEKIRVVFLLTDLGAWKTELLYLKMKEHTRFEPFLVIVPTEEEDDTENLIRYFERKKYQYCLYSYDDNIGRLLKADILMFQKPYFGNTSYGRFAYYKHLSYLFCYVNYAFHSINENWSVNEKFLNYAWQVYFENSLCVQGLEQVMDNKARNVLITGLPMQDEHLLENNNIGVNPWKNKKKLKRIIWAPHHTILADSIIPYSTFLEYCDAMIGIAKKYKDKVQFAFKPHPLLYNMLVYLWGKEKTDNYYLQWEIMENCQLESGKYTDLFKYSDAMIHDCVSFTIEYHYTKNPVLYLEKDLHHADKLNAFGKKAYELHYKAHCLEDIEQFIQNVIYDIDPMKLEREEFYRTSLMPPHGKTACENILNAILGEAEYKMTP